MTVTKQLPRIVGLTVLTGAGLLAQQGIASASVATDAATTTSGVTTGTPSSHVEVLAQKYSSKALTPAVVTPTTVASTSAKSCVASSAIKSATYTVDGKAVSGLRGNVTQGSKVVVNFVLNDNCDNTQVGLAAYQAPSAVWDAAQASQQVLVAHQNGTFKADGSTHTLTVTAPSCDFQVDFFTGDVLSHLSATNNYANPNGNLVDADNGGTETCIPPVVTPVTPPVTVVKDSCPTDEAARITSYTWTINGVKGFTTLAGNVKPGDKVEVDFIVAAGCDDEEVSLASYSAPSDTFSADTAAQQKLVSSQTGKFGVGEHVLDVTAADCFYQIDFVHGGVLTNLGPANSTNFYGSKIIATGTGGAECAVPAAPVTPVTPTTVVETPTTVPVQVEAETIVATPAAAPVATSTQALAFTGIDSSELAMIGSGLTLMGAAFERAASRLRRKNN